jgi:hypothetical protein
LASASKYFEDLLAEVGFRSKFKSRGSWINSFCMTLSNQLRLMLFAWQRFAYLTFPWKI